MNGLPPTARRTRQSVPGSLLNQVGATNAANATSATYATRPIRGAELEPPDATRSPVIGARGDTPGAITSKFRLRSALRPLASCTRNCGCPCTCTCTCVWPAPLPQPPNPSNCEASCHCMLTSDFLPPRPHYAPGPNQTMRKTKLASLQTQPTERRRPTARPTARDRQPDRLDALPGRPARTGTPLVCRRTTSPQSLRLFRIGSVTSIAR